MLTRTSTEGERLTPVTHGATNRTVDLGCLRLTETSHAPRTRLGKHRHAFPALTFVLTGGFSEDFGRGRVHECGPMSVLSKASDAVHSNTYSDVGARSFIIECTTDNELTRVIERSTPRLARPRVTLTLLRAYDAFRTNAPEQRVLAEESVLDLTRDVGNVQAARELSWLRRVEETVRDRCLERLSLTSLATDAGVHPIYLARAFRRRFGCSIGEHMTHSRLRLAMARLASTGDAVSRIAIDCGFADQPHLTRVFRHELGVPPARFRRLVSSVRG
jgi:AraC family transcriptional regulator